MIRIIECPRDAMQGIEEFIPTQEKIEYLNSLLAVGFDTIDFGSFVSAKAIPQLADTAEVLSRLELSSSDTQLLAVVANLRGAEEAAQFNEIRYLGFPFSISETFQQKNTNSSITESLIRVEQIRNLCETHGKELVIYISMGFGNPYGDPYNPELVTEWVQKIVALDIGIISLADTVGVGTPANIKPLFEELIPAFEGVEFGAHLHSAPHNWEEKIAAAYEAGCRRFDGALKGFGGCPMAEEELVGNMATENLIAYLKAQNESVNLNIKALSTASLIAEKIFPPT